MPLALLVMFPAILNPNFKGQAADIYGKAAKELTAARQWARAERAMKMAIALEPKAAWRYQDLGHILYFRAFDSGEPERSRYLEAAMAHLDRASHLSPMEVQCSNNLARVSATWAALSADEVSRYHRLSVAESFFSRALQVNPGNLYLTRQHAGILTALGPSTRRKGIF
jgi:tetratricopeptide (TPR) repeat protein